MDLEKLIHFFDFENCDYYYHITGKGIGEMIIEEGLLVDGTNILDTDNLKDTTTIEITPEMVSTYEEISALVEEEIDNPLLRDTSEMVIIGSPKEAKKQIVHDYDKIKEEHYFQGIISSHNIMGYIDENHIFNPNSNYEYGNEAFESCFYDSIGISY